MPNVPAPSGAVAPSTAPGLGESLGLAERWAEDEAADVLPFVELPGPRPAKPFLSTRRQAEAYLQERRTTGTITPRTAQQLRSILYSFAATCPDDPTRISLADTCPDDPSKIGRRHVLRWLDTHGHLSINSRLQYHNTARGFTSWLVRREVLRKDPFTDVPAPKRPRSIHRTLARDQALALLAACATPRETVLVILGLHTGLRRAELAGLEVGDLDLSARTIFVRRGKGGHQRLLPLSAEAAAVVGRYVAEAGMSSGPLLRSVRDPQAGISADRVGHLFTALAYRAGVKVRPRDGVGTHSTRHTFATSVYEGTSDVLAVRDLLGHVSLATTERYVRGMNIERLRVAVEGRTYLNNSLAEAAP